LRKFGLKWLFNFPPHLTGVSALPEETKSVNLTHFRAISVLVLDMRMVERFCLEAKSVFTTEPTQNDQVYAPSGTKQRKISPNHLQCTQVANDVSCHERRKYLRACICAQR